LALACFAQCRTTCRIAPNRSRARRAESFEAAFSKLLHAGVLAAPLYDEEAKKYIGFLDTRDLVSMALVVFDKAKEKEDDVLLKEIWQHATHAKSGLTTPYLASRNPFVSVEKRLVAPRARQAAPQSARHARAPRRRRRRVHRQKVVNVVSQMASGSIRRQAAQHRRRVARQGRSARAQADHCRHRLRLASRHHHRRVRVRVRRLSEARLLPPSAASPSSTRQGHIVGNLSARDIKNFVKQPRASLLRMPVQVSSSPSSATRRSTSACRSSPLTDASPVRRAVLLFAGSRVHRLYIVDNEQAFHVQSACSRSLTRSRRSVRGRSQSEMAPVD
jgi:hypothetical protein